MSNGLYLLDTNIISVILKKDDRVVNRLKEVLTANARVLLSAVVYFEVKRGLLSKDARKQLSFFEQLARTFHWDDLQRSDWDVAAELWATEIRQGRSLGDADLLIATQARRLNAIVVTDNEKHFAPLGVRIENWRV